MPLYGGLTVWWCWDVVVSPGFGTALIPGEQTGQVSDACGRTIAYQSDGLGSRYNYPSAGTYSWAIPGTIPSDACWGTWTMHVDGEQQFPDGVYVSSSITRQFRVYGSQADYNAAQTSQQSPTGGPIDPREQQGGCGCGHPVHQSVAQPVDTGTGNFWHTFEDLAIPGRGPSIDLSRTYNSLSASSDGPFGYGWTHSYATSLTLGSSTTVVNQANGAQATFTVTNGLWAAPPRVLATLVHNGNGTWTFTRRGTEIFVFDATGRLTSIRDLNGYATSLTYPSGSQMVVTDPAGRSLTFAYTGAHVTSVADSSSPVRSLTYQYDASATSPM